MKISTIILLALIFSSLTISITAFDDALQLDTEIDYSQYTFSANTNSNYHIIEGNYIIYGNYNDFSSELYHSSIQDKDKICIFYDLNLSDNVNTNLEILRNNVVVHYYKNDIPCINSYISNSTDTQSLIEDVDNYVNEIILEINEESNSPLRSFDYQVINSDGGTFEPLYSGSFRKDEQPYGYIDCDYVIRKYRANDISSLYLVESHISFTPGKIANGLGYANYDDWLNSSGYIKIKAIPATHEVGYGQIRYGGTPVFKDAYPVNSPSIVTIASSYSGGINLGYSTSTGFSLYDINIEGGSSTGANISYSYNKAYQLQDPALSAQKDPSDTEKYTWIYTYEDPKNETNHLQLGYMYEMNNEGHDLFEGNIALRFDYQMTVFDDGWWFFDDTYTFKGHFYCNFNYSSTQ